MVDISTLQKKNLINSPKTPILLIPGDSTSCSKQKLEVILNASSSLTYKQSASPITSSFKTSQIHAFLFPCHLKQSKSSSSITWTKRSPFFHSSCPLPNHKRWLFEMYTNHSLGLHFPMALRINKPKPLTMAYRPLLGPIYLSVLITITITHSFIKCQSQRPFYSNSTPSSYIQLLYFTNLFGTFFLKFFKWKTPSF